MLELDHLAIIAPNLEAGRAHVREILGVDMPFGGTHPQMGTHNCLMRIGDTTFLEIIAIDPDAPNPKHPRWFGLDDHARVTDTWSKGLRLRGWIARTNRLPQLLAMHGDDFGTAMQISRGPRNWLFAVRPDGTLPGDGGLPNLIDWGAEGSPAPAMFDAGIRLKKLALEHPDPKAMTDKLATIGYENPPVVRQGAEPHLIALFTTPLGDRELV